jgi:hypothetical protein
MNGSLGDGLVGKSVVALGGPFGTLGTDGGGVAFVQVRFERGLIGEPVPNGGFGFLQKFLKSFG